jgi:uncharacterized protein (DUF58 family)
MKIVWTIVVVAIVAVIQVAYYHKRGLRGVSYARGFSRSRAVEGETLEFIEQLTNEKLIPVPWVRVESRISSRLRFTRQKDHAIDLDQFHRSVFFLGAYSRITRRHEILCTRRGWYDCGKVNLVAGDLLGLAACRRDEETGCSLYVYPRIPELGELPESALKWQGDVTVRRWILPDPILVNGIREYRPGDPLKDVHWGATARTGQVQVKTRDYTVSPRVLLIFNTQIADGLLGGMQPEEVEFLERGIGVCAALASWCVSGGIEVGFASNGEDAREPEKEIYIPARTGDAQLDAVLEQLATLVIKMKTGIHSVLDRRIADGTTGMDILVVSNYWSDTIEKRAAQLRLAGNSVTHIRLK